MRHQRILVAEDNPVSRKFLEHLLEKHGYSAAGVTDGFQTLAALQKEDFDAVLMDVQMPGMDGFQTTAAIRKIEEATQKHIPIIATTAHALQGDEERCLAAGMDAYIAKPIHSKRLLNLIDSLVTGPPGRNETASRPGSPDGAFDPDSLLEGFGNDRKLVCEVIDIFLTDSPPLLERLHEALAAKDTEEVAAIAHSLKGSVGTFVAREAYQAACQLDATAREGDLARLEGDCAVLQDKVAQLQQALGAHRKQLRPEMAANPSAVRDNSPWRRRGRKKTRR